MLNTVKAIVKEGRIELMEQLDIPEGTQVFVTILTDEASVVGHGHSQSHRARRIHTHYAPPALPWRHHPR
jgi:hypothetical protein